MTKNAKTSSAIVVDDRATTKPAAKSAPKPEAKKIKPATEVNLPTLESLEPKTIVKGVRLDNKKAVEKEQKRLRQVAIDAAAAGNADVEDAALVAEQALTEAAADPKKVAKSKETAEKAAAQQKAAEKKAAEKSKAKPEKKAPTKAKDPAPKKEKVEKSKKPAKLSDSKIDDGSELTKFKSGKKRAEVSAEDKAKREKAAADKKAAAEKRKADAETKKQQREEESKRKAAEKADPMYAINKRRARAGGAYLMACAHCESPDVNANRSPYVGKIIPAGMTDAAKIEKLPEVLVKDYHCANCKLYTKAYAEPVGKYKAGTPLPLKEGDRVKTIRFQPVRATKNNTRAKGYTLDKALEIAGLEIGSVSPKEQESLMEELSAESNKQFTALYSLLMDAYHGATLEERNAAREVLNRGITLTFELPIEKPEPAEAPAATETKVEEGVQVGDSISVKLNGEPVAVEAQE